MGKVFYLIQDSKKPHLTCRRSSSVGRWKASLKWGKARRSNWNRVCHKTKLQANVRTASQSFYFPAFPLTNGLEIWTWSSKSAKASQSIESTIEQKKPPTVFCFYWEQTEHFLMRRMDGRHKKWDVTSSNTSWQSLISVFHRVSMETDLLPSVSGSH